MESAPTGCFKCGRPEIFPKSGNPAAAGPVLPKATKARVPRPKLTPETLLSEDGLGYVLRHFPRSFKYRGRGKRMYSEWHSHLLPYSTPLISLCIRSNKSLLLSVSRVASGVDPISYTTSRRKMLLILMIKVCDVDMDQPSNGEENVPSKKTVDADTNADAFQDSMLNEIFDSATDSRPTQKLPSDEEQNMDQSSELTEEQRARMEANRLKAMERAQNISEEQRLRMEANRLKALERAKARLEPNQA
ncbi:hypothetical protein HID58_069073 [Brassica napus]|uniref:Uncharacterized protein n=1 Tax=Brassica napus TaxID=3708 RepID=A0ABQ7ZN82_BRANA|nr:hypothetical protein HID58_069073 [Brassica napus]